MADMQVEKIGIVGAGAVGKAIASHFSRCGVLGVICNSRAPATLDKVVRTLGPTIRAGSLEETVAQEMVIIAIARARVPALLERVPDWEGRIVIDATQAPPSGGGDLLDRGVRSSSEGIADFTPGAHVVMAFNTLSATVLARPPLEAGGQRVIFYSGDHERAKRKVAALISGLGFAAVDLGSLAAGGRLQLLPDGALAMLNLIRLPAT